MHLSYLCTPFTVVAVSLLSTAAHSPAALSPNMYQGITVLLMTFQTERRSRHICQWLTHTKIYFHFKLFFTFTWAFCRQWFLKQINPWCELENSFVHIWGPLLKSFCLSWRSRHKPRMTFRNPVFSTIPKINESIHFNATDHMSHKRHNSGNMLICSVDTDWYFNGYGYLLDRFLLMVSGNGCRAIQNILNIYCIKQVLGDLNELKLFLFLWILPYMCKYRGLWSHVEVSRAFVAP